MTMIGWKSCKDPLKMLSVAKSNLSDQQLRLFACACARRVLPILDDPIYEQMLSLGEERALGRGDVEKSKLLGAELQRRYDEEYPGFGAPNAKVLAINAVGSPAFTESAFNLAVSVCKTAADALGIAAAEAGAASEYDDVYESTYVAEQAAQADILREICKECRGDIFEQ